MNVSNIASRLNLVVFMLMICLESVYSQESSSYEEYKNKINKDSEKVQENFKKDYDKYVEKEQANYLKFKKSIEKIWGTDEYVESTKKDWVEYSTDKYERTIVDFENGQANVEIIIDKNFKENEELIKNRFKDAVQELALSKGSTKDYSTKEEKAKTLSLSPVLSGQLQNQKGEIVTKDNAKEFANELVEKSKITEEIVNVEDGIEKTKVKLSFNLAPDNIKVRASKYLNEVQLYSDKYQMPQEIVYAVIHTESYFNPKAKSHVPAYGLMQLVPTSGGRDAYQYVFNKDKVLTANYLFQPDENIQLGVAYLRLLINRHFKSIKDSDSRFLCAIASYNTGAGNFSRAFTGRTNPNEIIPLINKMTYDELYSFLRKSLPYEETQSYIEKVTNRMELYKK